MNEMKVKYADIISKDDGFIHFAEAERFGHALATRDEYRNRNWAEMEAEGRRLWEAKQDRPWSEFREVVRQAWAEALPQFSRERILLEDSAPYSFKRMFRRHYETHYANSQYGYEQLAPAYYYGYDLAVDGRLSLLDWADIEPAAQQYWQTQSYAGHWQDFKAAVHHAWSETRKRRTPQY